MSRAQRGRSRDFHFALLTIPVITLLIVLVGASSPAVAGWLALTDAQITHVRSRGRNNIFYVGEPLSFVTNKQISNYEVRNYWGEIVDRGTDIAVLKPQSPGWYKLYLYDPSGSVTGGTMFCIFRGDSRFPPCPPRETPGGSHPSEDEVVRGVTGIGPQRHRASTNVKETFQRLDGDIALDQKYYLPFDPVRQRNLLIAFPDGTKDSSAVAQVVRRYGQTVKYWEPRNEPNNTNASTFAQDELPAFYRAVKSVDPTLKVLGPGVVTLGPPMLAWLDEFFKAGGANYIDGLSFHFYNNNNGDPVLLRKSLDSLNALLKKYGLEKLEKWQTEQGSFAACYGVYQPRLQARWTMLQMMLFEQYGIPKEHNHQWYDKSHGFWDMPAWWENGDGSLNPSAVMMRVWSEELFGKKFSSAFDFGTPGNQLYMGDLFSSKDGDVAAFMSAGSPDGKVDLILSNNTHSVRVSDAFGATRTVAVKSNHLTLDVPEVPVYVELPPGHTISVAQTEWGPNLARDAGVKVETSATPKPPNDASKIINGEYETAYWTMVPESGPWRIERPVLPFSVEIDLPKPANISRVVIFASPPWQPWSSLLNYELQCDDSGQWVTVAHVDEPPKTFKVPSPVNQTSVDSFWSERWIFQHKFKPRLTTKVRLLIHDATCGANATNVAQQAGGQGGPRAITLREVELYGK